MYRSSVGDDSGILFTQPLYSNTGVPFDPAAQALPVVAPKPVATAALLSPTARTTKPRYACPAGQAWQQLSSGAWKCGAPPAVIVESTPASVVTDFVAAPAPAAPSGMSTTEMIMIGVGAVAVLGLGFVLLKKK